jgi:hypothetical protein
MPTHIVGQDRRVNEKDVHPTLAQIIVLLTFCVITQIHTTHIYIQRLGEPLECKQKIFSLWVHVNAMCYLYKEKKVPVFTLDNR